MRKIMLSTLIVTASALAIPAFAQDTTASTPPASTATQDVSKTVEKPVGTAATAPKEVTSDTTKATHTAHKAKHAGHKATEKAKSATSETSSSTDATSGGH